MDRSKLKDIAAKIEAAVKVVADEYGVQIQYIGGNFTASSAVLKLEVAEVGTDGEAVTRHAEEFRLAARSLGLEPTDLGREFTSAGVAFKIVGANTRAAKYPILAKNLRTGKTYKFPEGRVLAALGRGVASRFPAFNTVPPSALPPGHYPEGVE
jgi:hypothetical protein